MMWVMKTFKNILMKMRRVLLACSEIGKIHLFDKNVGKYMILNYKTVFMMGLIFIMSSIMPGQTGSDTKAPDDVLITLHAEDAFLPGILSILAKESGYNIVTDPHLTQPDQISIHLDNVPIDPAINLVVRAVGLSY